MNTFFWYLLLPKEELEDTPVDDYLFAKTEHTPLRDFFVHTRHPTDTFSLDYTPPALANLSCT